MCKRRFSPHRWLKNTDFEPGSRQGAKLLALVNECLSELATADQRILHGPPAQAGDDGLNAARLSGAVMVGADAMTMKAAESMRDDLPKVPYPSTWYFRRPLRIFRNRLIERRQQVVDFGNRDVPPQIP